MKKTNFIVSGVFAAFAIIIIVIAAGYPPSNHGVPGPGLFPILIACKQGFSGRDISFLLSNVERLRCLLSRM